MQNFTKTLGWGLCTLFFDCMYEAISHAHACPSMRRTHVFKHRTDAHPKLVVISEPASVDSIASPGGFVFFVSFVVHCMLMQFLLFQKFWIVSVDIRVHNIHVQIFTLVDGLFVAMC